MKPTIGRIVIFHCDENQKKSLNNHQNDAPAVITAVWGESCVNLKVIADGEANIWITSVTEGTGERQWSWPDLSSSL